MQEREGWKREKKIVKDRRKLVRVIFHAGILVSKHEVCVYVCVCEREREKKIHS